MPSNPFAPPIHVPIPAELADKSALLAHLGLGQNELNKIRWYRRRMYHTFNISKSSGKIRQIDAPDKRLKYFQRKLLPLIEKIYRIRNPVHGFVRGKSVKSNAKSHLRKRHLLNIDLKDFFPTITENRVVGVLVSVGVEKEVAETIGYICCCNGHLPQGAPTSPILSNMVCFRMDRELLAYAKKTRCIYTRYADDISLSSRQPMTQAFEGTPPSAGNVSEDTLALVLRNIIQTNGFRLNPSKLHYADRHSRKIVTGVKVNELLNIDRSFVRNIRAILYSIENSDILTAQVKFTSLGFSGDLRAHLRGKIEWLKNVKGQSDPVFRAIASRYNSCFPSHPISMALTDEEKRERATWVTENPLGQGTLFFLEGFGLVTAAHCVTGLSEIEIFHPSKHSNKFKATIDHCDDHRDLALLSHTVPVTDYYSLKPTTSEIYTGENVVALGYPSWGFGDRLNVRPGVVSTLTTQSGVKLIEVTQNLGKGMSGGPLLNASGQVVGVIHKGGAGEDRDFAIHYDVLKDWYASLP